MGVTTVPAAGQMLGKYRVHRELGAGGMGRVYLATDTRLDREVALKVLARDLSGDNKFQRRFQSEAKAIAKLSHPHIVRIHAFETVDSLPTIEMEYLRNGSLADRLRRGQLDIPIVLEVIRPVLGALASCHAVGLVHRDIKPSNILFDEQWQVRISDFGLAAAYSANITRANNVTCTSAVFLGTPRYAPLEAWDGAAPSPAWDVYSAAVVLYEMLTGRPLFLGDTPLEILKSKLELAELSHDALTGRVSEPTRAVLAHALDARPENRPQTASDLLEILDGLEESQVVEASSAKTIPLRSRTEPNKRKIPRTKSKFPQTKSFTRSRVLIAASLAAGLIAVAAIFPFGNKPETSDTPHPISQASLFASSLPTAEDLLGAYKSPTPDNLAVFDLFKHGDDKVSPRAVLVIQLADQGVTEFFWAGDGKAAVMTGTEREDAVYLEGNWGQYRDVGGSILQIGDLTGSGIWSIPGEVMTATFEFFSEHDATHWTETVTLKKSEEVTTDAQFALHHSSSPRFLPLLYNDLLPRRLPWAKRIAEQMTPVLDSWVEVPLMNSNPGEMLIDGKLSETIWDTAISEQGDTPGHLTGRPLIDETTMLVRVATGQLFLGFRVPKSSDRDIRFEVALLEDVSIPIESSPIYLVRFDSDGNQEVARLRNENELPVDIPISSGVQSTETMWQGELVVPSSQVGTNTELGIGDVLHINARATVIEPEGGGETIAEWGFPDLGLPQFGTVIALNGSQ